MYRVFFMDLDIRSGHWYDKVLGVFERLEDAERFFNENIDYYQACGHMLYLQDMPVEEHNEIWG